VGGQEAESYCRKVGGQSGLASVDRMFCEAAVFVFVQIYVYDSTVVAPYALLLFGGDLTVEHVRQAHHRDSKRGLVAATSTVTVGGWIR